MGLGVGSILFSPCTPLACVPLSIQYPQVKIASDLRQVSGFLQVLWIPSPIKLTTTI